MIIKKHVRFSTLNFSLVKLLAIAVINVVGKKILTIVVTRTSVVVIQGTIIRTQVRVVQ